MADLWEAGELPYLMHLSGGNEDDLIEIFRGVKPGDWVLSSHRNHYHALLSGMSPERLEQLIHEGNSMFVFERHRGGCARTGGPLKLNCEVNFFSSSILAGTCAIAAGVAWQANLHNAGLPGEERRHVWCFLGDGAEDEGHFYEAARFVEAHQLPCTFIIEDNDRSVDTTKEQRYAGWQSVQWLERCNLDTWCIHVNRYHYQPTYPHAGSGCKHHIVFKKKGNS